MPMIYQVRKDCRYIFLSPGPIAIIVHDGLPGMAPNGEVIDGAGEFKTKRPGHNAGVSPSSCLIARPDPIGCSILKSGTPWREAASQPA
jgi:hypothetical protein